MIIECINCHKKFEVNSDLIPESGRNIQCGSCNHIWFFNINNEEYSKNLESSSQEIATKFEENKNPNHQEIGSINSDETEVILTIINQVTSAVITTITYTVPYTDGTSTYTESINLPIGTYLYTLEQNFTFNAVGVTQLSLI